MQAARVALLAWGLARLRSREVLLPQNGRHELSAAAHARLVEDRFQVVLDGVLGDVQLSAIAWVERPWKTRPLMFCSCWVSP